jgi:hypothetical protein
MPKGNRTERRGHRPKEFDDIARIPCTTEQKLAWENAADDAGAESLSAWVRQRLDEAAKERSDTRCD